MFPSISSNRDAFSNPPLCYPRSLFSKDLQSKKTNNPKKLSNINMMGDFSIPNKAKTNFKGNIKLRSIENRRIIDENESLLAPVQKRKRLECNYSQDEIYSPSNPQARAVQDTLLELTRTDSGKNKTTIEEWQTPEKKFHIFWDFHENEKQAKLSEMKNHLFETEFSRLTNDYQILEVLGRGSFGKVYRCINKVDKNQYAIKETFRSFTGKNKVYGLNETQALASLTAIGDSIHVVRYYNSWIEDDKLCLVMEFCPSSLREERKVKQKFTENEVRKVLRDICLGLSYLHRHNIVHLDIKPENILISKSKKYKIGDMGQSRMVKRSGDIEEGDSRYVAPELLNCDDCEDDIDLKKCDIFSLGMTAFELLTNYNAPPNGDEWHKLRNGQLNLLESMKGISDRLKGLIRRMLNKDPNVRPTAQELLLHYLPSEMELKLKWEKIENHLLQERKNELEKKLKQQTMRRKSVS